jgi:branched-chain amino acid transport system substrate-binding protein
MAKKSELPVLILSVLLTGALLGGVAWLLGIPKKISAEIGSAGSERVVPLDAIASADGSSGVSILPGTPSDSKQKGLDAFKAKNYAAAQDAFKADKNDPESLIYLNNAKANAKLAAGATAYTLAVVVPASTQPNQAKEILRGAAQAQNNINQNQGSNAPIRLLLMDDGGEPDKVKTLAAKLVEHKEILGVVGHFSSDATLAAAPIYQAGQLPMISPTSNATDISELGDYIFRTVPSASISMATLANYLLDQLNKKKVVVFWSSQSSFSQSVESQFTQKVTENGGSVVAEFDVSNPEFSLGNIRQTAEYKDAEAIMMALPTTEIDKTSLIIALNQRELPMLGSDSLYNLAVLSAGGANVQGLTVSTPWHVLSHEQSPFVREAKALWAGNINWRTASTYDATMALEAALSVNASRTGIAETLAGQAFSAEGATGPVKFFANGDRNQSYQLVQVTEGDRSGTGYDFVPIEAGAPAKQP